MMYPRLRLAKTLLTDDGVMFISIDDNEVHNLRKVCDEVFGEDNFVAQIVWERAFSPVNLKKHFSESHDFILCYARNLESLLSFGLTRTDVSNARYKNLDNDIRGAWISSDMTVGPAIEEKLYDIITPSGKIVRPSSGRCWLFNQEKFEEMVADNRIWFGEKGENMPRVKKFYTDVKEGITPMTIWKHADVGHSQDSQQKLKKLFDGKSYFDYPKSVDLVKRMMELYTSSSDIILDFFSGSATTAHAVMQLNAEDGGNRKFIMVQLPEKTGETSEASKAGYKNICEIGKERIKRAGDKVFEEWEENQRQMSIKDTKESEEQKPLDIGFKVFKLDSSNMKKWDGTPLEDSGLDDLWNRLNDMTDTIKPNRTDMDVVYEILLKFGIDLNTVIIPLEFEDQGKTKKAYSVREDCLMMICLAKDVSVEMVEQMAEYTPGNIVFAEDCFGTDTEITNAELVLKDRDINIRVI